MFTNDKYDDIDAKNMIFICKLFAKALCPSREFTALERAVEGFF